MPTCLCVHLWPRISKGIDKGAIWHHLESPLVNNNKRVLVAIQVTCPQREGGQQQVLSYVDVVQISRQRSCRIPQREMLTC